MDCLFSTASSLLSPLCRRVPLPLPEGDLPWLQALNFNSLLIPNKPIIAADISGSLFDLDQQKVHPEWVPFGLALASIYHRNRSAPSTFPHPPTHRQGHSEIISPPTHTIPLLCHLLLASVQFSSVTQSYPTLCDPIDCSMPGLPVHHQLLEHTQSHVH